MVNPIAPRRESNPSLPETLSQGVSAPAPPRKYVWCIVLPPQRGGASHHAHDHITYVISRDADTLRLRASSRAPEQKLCS